MPNQTVAAHLSTASSCWSSYQSRRRPTGRPIAAITPARGATAERLTLPLRQAWVARTAGTPRSAWAGEEGRTIEGKVLEDRTRFDDALQVAVVGDRVYYGSSVDHAVYCRRLATGELLWRHVTGGPVRLAPTVWNNRCISARMMAMSIVWMPPTAAWCGSCTPARPTIGCWPAAR